MRWTIFFVAVGAIITLVHPIMAKRSSTSCGSPTVKSQIQRIVGGKTALPYSWPWQAALFKYQWLVGYRQTCGASLISNEWVMTAAHCVQTDTIASKYKIKLGVHNKASNSESGEVVAQVKEIRIHPRFNSITTAFDVALMKLSHPVDFTDHISPICLPDQDETLPKTGATTVVTGWGLLKTGGDESSTLQEVAVPLVDHRTCKASYPDMIQEQVMFCAGALDGGKDSCNGDSGGPLVYYDQARDSWKQLGIVSWGDQICAKAYKPGVYSKVASYIDWIRLNIG